MRTLVSNVLLKSTANTPMLDYRRPENFLNDGAFIHFVEKKADKICGPYGEKEEEAKIASLGGKCRLNRIFDLMGVEYEDNPLLAKAGSGGEAGFAAAAADTAGHGKGKGKGRKRKSGETDDVHIGHDVAKPSKRSKKFILGDEVVVIDEAFNQV